MGEGGAKWAGRGTERCALKEKAFIIGAAVAGKNCVLCVSVCVSVCLGMWILSELVFFPACVRVCVCFCVLCV